MIKLAIPVLPVSNSVEAEDFYGQRLGFPRQFAHRPDETDPDPCDLRVARDGVSIHLSSFPGDGAFLVVDDVDALNAEYVAITLEPIDQSWGNREMYVKDPDGNSLSFVQDGPGP